MSKKKHKPKPKPKPKPLKLSEEKYLHGGKQRQRFAVRKAQTGFEIVDKSLGAVGLPWDYLWTPASPFATRVAAWRYLRTTIEEKRLKQYTKHHRLQQIEDAFDDV